jgi:L-ribulokinase
MYGALTNSILFGLRSIVEGMQKGGLHFDSMVATGGIARKSEVLMKRLASVLNLPILALFQQETCALGAAMYGSVACGYFADLEEAQKAMASRQGVLYEPVAPDVALFDALYEKYLEVGASMGPLW